VIASSRRALPLVKRMFGAALGIEGVDRHQLRHTVRVAWLIRTAASEDRDAILSVVRDAFSDDDRDAHEEVVIVRDTWSADASPEGCELVAVDDDAVVGHVLGARGNLGGREVLAVAPLGVASSRQGQGIGTALMTELLRRAEAAGRWPLVVLLGNPLYYGGSASSRRDRSPSCTHLLARTTCTSSCVGCRGMTRRTAGTSRIAGRRTTLPKTHDCRSGRGSAAREPLARQGSLAVADHRRRPPQHQPPGPRHVGRRGHSSFVASDPTHACLPPSRPSERLVSTPIWHRCGTNQPRSRAPEPDEAVDVRGAREGSRTPAYALRGGHFTSGCSPREPAGGFRPRCGELSTQ